MRLFKIGIFQDVSPLKMITSNIASKRVTRGRCLNFPLNLTKIYITILSLFTKVDDNRPIFTSIQGPSTASAYIPNVIYVYIVLQQFHMVTVRISGDAHIWLRISVVSWIILPLQRKYANCHVCPHTKSPLTIFDLSLTTRVLVPTGIVELLKNFSNLDRPSIGNIFQKEERKCLIVLMYETRVPRCLIDVL